MTDMFWSQLMTYADCCTVLTHTVTLTLKSDAIVKHFTPKILQKAITLLETEPF